jgi:plastocyanin
MKRNQIIVVALTMCFSLASSTLARAATLTGKVTGSKGASVVYVEAITGKTFPPPAKPFPADQKGLMFHPHILAVPVGSTVSFLNGDSVAHNIFWPSVGGDKKQRHNLGTWPTGESRTFKFDSAGVVSLLCNVHPEMSGYIVVVPTPYYSLTDDSGTYSLTNLPDGQYKVSAWHEGTKVETKPISVAGTATLDFALSK